MEIEIIRFLQSFANETLTFFFKAISYASHYWGFIAFALILFIIYKKSYTFLFVLTYGLSIGTNYILKFIIDKPRPYVADPSILNIFSSTGNSMPSGHSVSVTIMSVFMIYAVMQKVNKLWLKNILVFFCVSLVPLTIISRMYLGQHYLSDTVVGVCIGLFFSLFAIWIYKKETTKSNIKKETKNQNNETNENNNSEDEELIVDTGLEQILNEIKEKEEQEKKEKKFINI